MTDLSPNFPEIVAEFSAKGVVFDDLLSQEAA